MPYSFVWLYLFKCVSHTQFLLIKHKKIFECFKLFLESLLFLQKYQKQCCSVLATWSWVNPVACPQSRAYSDGFRNSLAGQCPSREKYLGNFPKIWVFRFLVTHFGYLFASGSFSRELTQKFSRFPCSSREKHLEKFSKILSLSCLATCPGDLFVTWFSREKWVFCTLRTVFKTFQFSLKHFLLFIVLFVQHSHKLTVFHSIIHQFHHFLNFNLQEKVWDFLFSLSISWL